MNMIQVGPTVSVVHYHYLLVKAFITYARPILEYNSPLWSPTLKKNIISIESVQRKFTKRISAMSGLSYHSRLKALNLESLELRRLRADLLLAYKIFFGLLRVNSDNFSLKKKYIFCYIYHLKSLASIYGLTRLLTSQKRFYCDLNQRIITK